MHDASNASPVRKIKLHFLHLVEWCGAAKCIVRGIRFLNFELPLLAPDCGDNTEITVCAEWSYSDWGLKYWLNCTPSVSPHTAIRQTHWLTHSLNRTCQVCNQANSQLPHWPRNHLIARIVQTKPIVQQMHSLGIFSEKANYSKKHNLKWNCNWYSTANSFA